MAQQEYLTKEEMKEWLKNSLKLHISSAKLKPENENKYGVTIKMLLENQQISVVQFVL